MRAVLPVLLAAMMFVTASPAHADDVAEAQTKFRAGATAYREARYKQAIDLFLEANRLDPHPELIFNVGQAYEKLGDVPNALRAYREYLRLSPAAGDRATVETSIKNLEQRLRDKGVQQVSVFSNPSGATVYLDGAEVGSTPATFETRAGRHLVVLKATGFPDTAKEFVLGLDRSMDIEVTLQKVGSGSSVVVSSTATTTPTATAPPATTAVLPPPPPSEQGPTGLAAVRPWTWAALGVGVIGLGTSVGLELARAGSETAAREDPTQVGFKEKYDAMVSNQTGARVMVGIGAVAMAAGAVLLVIDLRGKPEAGSKTTGKTAVSRPSIGVSCGPFGCGVVAAGTL